MKEADIKRTIADFLEIGMVQGKWYYDRLNSGEVIEVRGNTRRRVKLCREGTADFFVMKKDKDIEGYVYCGVIFLEVKGGRGRQRPEQVEFQRLVEAMGAEYFVIRNIENLMEILE